MAEIRKKIKRMLAQGLIEQSIRFGATIVKDWGLTVMKSERGVIKMGNSLNIGNGPKSKNLR